MHKILTKVVLIRQQSNKELKPLMPKRKLAIKTQLLFPNHLNCVLFLMQITFR